jgi:hypothetical protein
MTHCAGSNDHKPTAGLVLSWEVVADGERGGLSTAGLMDDLGVALAEFLPHHVAAGWHGVRFARLGRIATDRPVQFARIDFYMRSSLFGGPVYLGLQLCPKVVG